MAESQSKTTLHPIEVEDEEFARYFRDDRPRIPALAVNPEADIPSIVSGALARLVRVSTTLEYLGSIESEDGLNPRHVFEATRFNVKEVEEMLKAAIDRLAPPAAATAPAQ